MKPEYRPYYNILTAARTKLFSEVTLPALLGAAYAYSTGYFSIPRFALIMIGLIFSEMLYLLLSDYRSLDTNKEKGRYPLLPGNPVFNPMSLPRKKIPQMLGVSLIGWFIVIAFFVIQLGWFVAILMAALLLLALLRLVPALSFVNILPALMPPLISFTVYFVLSNDPDIRSFIIGFPVLWIYAAMLITHRDFYKSGVNSEKNYFVPMLVLYMLSIVNILYNFNAELYHPLALASVLVFILPLRKLSQLSKTEKKDLIPAMSLGYIVHGLVLIILIVSVLIN